MKVRCRLISRHTYKEITSADIEVKEGSSFGLSKDNPFPASDVWTGNFFPDGNAAVTYIVREAFGDYGSPEPEEKVAA